MAGHRPAPGRSRPAPPECVLGQRSPKRCATTAPGGCWPRPPPGTVRRALAEREKRLDPLWRYPAGGQADHLDDGAAGPGMGRGHPRPPHAAPAATAGQHADRAGYPARWRPTRAPAPGACRRTRPRSGHPPPRWPRGRLGADAGKVGSRRPRPPRRSAHRSAPVAAAKTSHQHEREALVRPAAPAARSPRGSSPRWCPAIVMASWSCVTCTKVMPRSGVRLSSIASACAA